ncbi:hypothetical protein EC930624_A0031 [Escherichia coli 93.0624]|nr:hypothetical protein EC930624_A0031 [Escherichia coli 93.0624]
MVTGRPVTRSRESARIHNTGDDADPFVDGHYCRVGTNVIS